MPVVLLVGGESPLDRVPSEPGLNVEVVSYIAAVVVVDERMMNRRVVKNDGDDYENKTQNKCSLRWSSEQACPGLRRSPLLEFRTNMLGFQTSRSHSSPVWCVRLEVDSSVRTPHLRT